MTHIAVLGAGITGITTAFQLMERGFDVTVVDRQRYAGMETSFANGGQLSASNAEVWTHPTTILKGLKWLMRKDAPLLMNPKPDWHKLSWMTEFLANIPNYKNNTVKTAELAIRSRDHMLGMADRANVDFDWSPCGILHFYETEADFAHARDVSRLLSKGGLTRTELSPNEVRAKEPTLTGDFTGGFWTESDSTGDIHKFTTGLAEACKARGVNFIYGADVEKVEDSGDRIRIFCNTHALEAGKIVVCAGVGSRTIARQLGDRANVYPVKGYSITVDLKDRVSQLRAPTTSLLDDKAKLVTSRLGETRFRVAGTAEFNGINYDIRADRIKPLTDWVNRHFPEVSTEYVTPWTGLRPMMPSMMPKVERGRSPRVFYNTGHGHLGWTLSGITSHLIADQIQSAEAKTRPLPSKPSSFTLAQA
ncbi:MAG: D-amino acid dehydrogenase [Pseudomonadota bacterium]